MCLSVRDLSRKSRQRATHLRRLRDIEWASRAATLFATTFPRDGVWSVPAARTAAASGRDCFPVDLEGPAGR